MLILILFWSQKQSMLEKVWWAFEIIRCKHWKLLPSKLWELWFLHLKKVKWKNTDTAYKFWKIFSITIFLGSIHTILCRKDECYCNLVKKSLNKKSVGGQTIEWNFWTQAKQTSYFTSTLQLSLKFTEKSSKEYTEIFYTSAWRNLFCRW